MKNLVDFTKTGIKPIVLTELIMFAEKYDIRQVILFGSRARGDYHRASDIDLAVHGKNITEFTLAVKEDTSTLLDFDVVNLEKSIQKNLLTSIEREGIILYEKI